MALYACCSDFVEWRMRGDITKDANGDWILTPGKVNEVTGGSIASPYDVLTPHP
jgi:hypothetical protein